MFLKEQTYRTNAGDKHKKQTQKRHTEQTLGLSVEKSHLAS